MRNTVHNHGWRLRLYDATIFSRSIPANDLIQGIDSDVGTYVTVGVGTGFPVYIARPPHYTHNLNERVSVYAGVDPIVNLHLHGVSV